MSAITFPKAYTPARPAAPAARPARAAEKGFFRRVLEAIVAARAEQAVAEVDRYYRIHGRDMI